MPKLFVHHIFSAGVAALILARSLPALPASVLGATPIFIPSFVGGFIVPSASLPSWILYVPLYFAATLSDIVIDKVGHHRKLGAPFATRAWSTHAPYTAPIFGGLVGAGVGAFFLLVSSFLGLGAENLWQWTIAAGVIASFCHLIADANTMGGIFLTGSTRLRLMHLDNDNPAWCLSLIGIGAFGLIQGLNLWLILSNLFHVVGV